MKKPCKVCGAIRGTLGPTILRVADSVLRAVDRHRHTRRIAAKLDKRQRKAERRQAPAEPL